MTSVITASAAANRGSMTKILAIGSRVRMIRCEVWSSLITAGMSRSHSSWSTNWACQRGSQAASTVRSGSGGRTG